jgi:hypothetical protein
MFRAIRVVFGYIGLIMGGIVWFVCGPLAAYTLWATKQFPFDYFGLDSSSLPSSLEFFLPKEIQPAVGGICLAFTLYGLVIIYLNVRKLRILRGADKR